MLNGAVTLGTEDGANVEIHDLVGDDNIYIFGDLSETVVERYANGSYCAAKYYNNNPVIKEAVDFIKVALDRSTDNVLGFGIKMGCQKNFNVIVWDEEDIPEEYRV